MTINITNFLQAIGLALAPAIYLGIIIYGKDKVEKQPKKDLLIVFLLGIFIVPISAILETHLESTVPFESQSNFQLFIQNFCVVAFIEEMLKFLVFFLVINRLNSFTEPFDGIVFGTFLALGFSSFENFMYAYMTAPSPSAPKN
jgi:RsiW-degrading membrane proteinase PrsW (M82 family)